MVDKDGLVFSSNSRHKLKIDNAKILKLGNNVYLKNNGKLVCVENVDKVFVYKKHLYFTSLGLTKIKLNLNYVYKYFLIDIDSEILDMKNLKNLAKNDIKNHIFPPPTCCKKE